MDFWDLTKLLFRRWYIATPLLLLAVASTGLAAATIEPDYVATSYVQLIPPTGSAAEDPDADPAPRNPWFDLGLGSLSRAAIITVQDQTVLDQLDEDGYSTNFTIGFDTQLPVITFEVIGDTEQQATETSEELVRRFSESVAALQSEYGVSGDQSITTRRLDLGDNLKESTSKIKRALVAIAATGALLSAGVTVAIDAWLRRRARRRAVAAGQGSAAGPPSGPAATGMGPQSAGVAASPGAEAERTSGRPTRIWQPVSVQPVAGAKPGPAVPAGADPGGRVGAIDLPVAGAAPVSPAAPVAGGPPTMAGGTPTAETSTVGGGQVPPPRKSGGEYRSSMSNTDQEAEPQQRTPASDDTAVIAIQSDDATMVLPRTSGDFWAARSNGSKSH
ncbi:hypothetical protein ACN27F_25635 [Solwaraspora sp. WMMB335]|uniref:hypothetical protein n=1 Tax=Solwaraspora sp. WMMB335 TaxID=3404118 RepID=UPI003B947442